MVGALTTAGGIACYGTLEGYFKCVDQKDGKQLYKYKTASGIIGNVFTYEHKGKQYIGVYLGRWWLGRHRPRRRLDQPDGWLGRRRWLRLSERLHRSRRLADSLGAAIVRQ